MRRVREMWAFIDSRRTFRDSRRTFIDSLRTFIDSLRTAMVNDIFAIDTYLSHRPLRPVPGRGRPRAKGQLRGKAVGAAAEKEAERGGKGRK